MPRSSGTTDRSSWSRFDTPGSTVYLAEDRRTAYAETLAMARVGKDFRDAVTFAAGQFGITVETARRMIHDDWTRNGNMVPGWLPANWRDGRLMYTLQIPSPTLVDRPDSSRIESVVIQVGLTIACRGGTSTHLAGC